MYYYINIWWWLKEMHGTASTERRTGAQLDAAANTLEVFQNKTPWRDYYMYYLATYHIIHFKKQTNKKNSWKCPNMKPQGCNCPFFQSDSWSVLSNSSLQTFYQSTAKRKGFMSQIPIFSVV